MKPSEASSAQVRVLMAITAIFTVTALLAADYSAYPDWWFARGIVAADPVTGENAAQDDFAALNQGQLKNMATAAYDELEQALAGVGGAGSEIADMVNGWYDFSGGERIPKTTGVDNYAVVNLGQLKNVAKPFYDRLDDPEVGLASVFPWPVSGQADDFAMANVGQAKRMFQFAFGILAPDPLTVQFSSPNGPVHVEWTPVWRGQTYKVERRKIYGDPPVPTSWTTVGTFPNTISAIDDTALLQWGVYGYRVYASAGTIVSAPSNEARVHVPRFGNWDKDGDGTFDWEDDDIDGDGISNDEELALGTDLYNTDTDRDGASDYYDRYPTDERRDEDIVRRSFAVVNLQESLDLPPDYPSSLLMSASRRALGADPDPLCAIDEQMQTAWASIEPAGQATPDGDECQVIRVAVWADGQIVSEHTQATPLFETGTKIPAPGMDPRAYFTVWNIEPVGIKTEDGIVYGKIRQRDWWWDQSQSGGIWIPSSSGERSGTFTLDDGSLSVTLSVNDTHDYQQYSHTGKLFEVWNFSDDPADPTAERHQVPLIGSNPITALVWDEPSGDPHPDITAFAISPDGHTVVEAFTVNGATGELHIELHLCEPNGNATLISELLPSPYAINDEGWIVGSLRREIYDENGKHEDPDGYEDPETTFPDGQYPDGTQRNRSGRGELGFLWDPVNKRRTFHDLLPEKFRKQIRSAGPYLITNKAVDGSTQISFTAELLVDIDSPGGPSTDWKAESFILTMYDDPAIKPTVTHSVVNNAGIPVDYREVSVNKNGIGVGTATFPEDGEPNNGQTKPCLKMPLEFFAKNILQTGFDLPMWNDRDGKLNGATPPEPEPVGKRDQDPPAGQWPGPQWWTTVHYSGNYLRENENIQVYAGVGANLPAKLYARVIDPGHLNGSGVVRLAAPDLNTPLVSWQALSISTNSQYPTAATAARVVGTIGIFTTPPGQPKEQKLQVLHVDAMPVWLVRLRFYEVYAENVAAERIPADFKDVGSIIAHLNEIYRQACIKFVADPIEERQVAYESAPADHKLDSGGATVSAEQTRLFNEDLPPLKAINVFILHEFTSSSRVGFSSRDLWPDRCAVQTKPFETPRLLHEFRNTIAHEIGHLLNMSVHDWHNQAGEGGRRHDWGYYPERYYWKNGNMVESAAWDKYDSLPPALKLVRMRGSLMGNTTNRLVPTTFDWRWIRHEDWQVANEKAREFGDLFE